MKKIVFVITIVLCLWTQSLEGRPLSDDLKNWPATIFRTLRQLMEPLMSSQEHHVRFNHDSELPPMRGSPEETRHILNEISKINQAFGYTRKSSDIALPRQGPSSGNTNYFYPRPVYQPAFIQNSKRPPYPGRHDRGLREKAFYPSQYLQLPIEFKTIKYFKSAGKKFVVPYTKKSIFERPIYVSENIRYPKSMKNEEKSPKLKQNGGDEYEDEEPVGIIESIVKIVAGPPPEEEEEIENYENYDSLSESNEEEEDEVRRPTLNPPLLNDKFIYHKIKDQPQNDQNAALTLNLPRSFNFSTPTFIKNLTDKFAKAPSTVQPITLAPLEKDEGVEVSFSREKSQEDYDSEEVEIEGLRAPWGGKGSIFPAGPQAQRDTLKQGGLIIQRLRVKNGSIAVAGPGGVATAGSGGTAIVGPEGLAITHPRSLTIAGPGARVYEVPESTNLEKQLRSLNADGTPENGVLVAVGPTVHYNSS